MAGSRRTAAKSKPSRESRASSSGSGHSGSPTGNSFCEISPRGARVGQYPLDDLPTLWDGNPIIRERMRSKGNFPLVVGLDQFGEEAAVYVEATQETLQANEYVMMPIFHLMAKNTLMLPHIDRLIQAIDSFYKLSKRPRDAEHCYQQAWAIRRLIGYLKHQCYRDLPLQD